MEAGPEPEGPRERKKTSEKQIYLSSRAESQEKRQQTARSSSSSHVTKKAKKGRESIAL